MGSLATWQPFALSAEQQAASRVHVLLNTTQNKKPSLHQKDHKGSSGAPHVTYLVWRGIAVPSPLSNCHASNPSSPADRLPAVPGPPHPAGGLGSGVTLSRSCTETPMQLQEPKRHFPAVLVQRHGIDACIFSCSSSDRRKEARALLQQPRFHLPFLIQAHTSNRSTGGVS